jgi:hypothetical protein
MGFATACAIGGRHVVAWSMPVGADRRTVAAIAYGVQLIGTLLLCVVDANEVALIVLAIALFGSGTQRDVAAAADRAAGVRARRRGACDCADRRHRAGHLCVRAVVSAAAAGQRRWSGAHRAWRGAPSWARWQSCSWRRSALFARPQPSEHAIRPAR